MRLCITEKLGFRRNTDEEEDETRGTLHQNRSKVGRDDIMPKLEKQEDGQGSDGLI